MSADPLIRELLLGDDVSGQAELLLNLLSDAASGRELSSVVSEVIQVTIAGGVGHQQVKKLAYDLCKAVPLLPSDYSLLVDGIKNDISCGVPENQVLALRYLPHLPAEHLLHLLEKGDISNFVVPHTRNISPPVRSAATTALAAILLVPQVQAALAAASDLAVSGGEWWDGVVDGVGDSMPEVLVAALAATNSLFEAAGTASSNSSRTMLCVAAARRAALRLAAGIGPLMDTWRMLPSHAQVPVIQLLGHLWGHLVAAEAAADSAAASTSGRNSSSSSAAHHVPESSSGSISAALPGILSYLSVMVSSLNPAVKLEAARVILRLSKAHGRGPGGAAAGGSRGGGLLDRLRLVGAVPPAMAAGAIEALLELKGRLLVEAALEEVVSLIAAHLDVLQVPTRMSVLQRLWPMIALLQSPTDRLTAFAHSWRAALELALSSTAANTIAGQPEGAAAVLEAILSDPFLDDVISERPSLSNLSTVASGDMAAAGPTGSSSVNAAAAGATGSSVGVSSEGRRLSDADAMGLGVKHPGEKITLAASTLGASRSKKVLSKATRSARSLVTSGAALASNVGSSVLTAIPLPKFMDTPAPARAQLPATLKQELVCTLLEVLQQHPAADAALKLPLGRPVPLPAAGHAGDLTAAAAATDSKQPESAASTPTAAANGNHHAAAAAAGGMDNGAEPSAATPLDGVAALAAAAGVTSTPTSPVTSGPANGVITPSPGKPAVTSASQPVATRPQFGPDDVSVSPVVASLQAQVVLWLGAAVTALNRTRACLHWEPLVPPPMPGQPPTPPLPPLASVNLTTVPVDLWLQLLQLACQAVRGVVRLHGYDSLKAIYRCNGGRMLPQLSPWDSSGSLARTAESSAATLQSLLVRELSDWRTLALAVRPRVLWVAAHYLELPSMLDTTWGVLLGCVEEAVLRSTKMEGDARTRQLAASAREGLLLKKFAMPQLSNVGRDKSGAHTTFDAAAASALVEMHEYRSDGLQVGLTVLQYLVWVVQAMCIAAGSFAATKSGPVVAAAGPSEQVLAKKLLDLVKAAGAAEAAGADVRDWCKRMSRTLNALLDPTGSGVGLATAAAAAQHTGGPAFAMAPPTAGGPSARGSALPSGYNAVAGFSALGFGGNDSDSDDDEGLVGLSREQRLQRKLGLDKSGPKKGSKAYRRAGDSSDDDVSNQSSSESESSSSSSSSSSSESEAATAAGGSSDDSDVGEAGRRRGSKDGAQAAVLPNPLSGLKLSSITTSTPALTSAQERRAQRKAERKAAKAAKKLREARAEAEQLLVGAPDTASGVWGYPFGGPRSQTLFISKRSRRYRLLKWQLALAMLNAEEDAGAVGAADSNASGGGSGGFAAAVAAGVLGSRQRSSGLLGAAFGAGSSSSGVYGPAAGSGSALSSLSGSSLVPGGLTDATGPVFSAESGFRLDQPGFWDSLQSRGSSGWQELTGPNDPVVLTGKYSAAEGAAGAAGELTVVLRAFNRLPVDLEDVEVAVRLVGPVRAERREASWMLPRLLPTEAAQHSFSVMPTGYGRMEVHARILLPVPQLASEMSSAPAPALCCQPLVISMAQLLTPPACPPATAQEMLALWASLPIQVELSATAVWPGLDGLLLLLSALVRQPLHCCWAHMLPIVCGAQAAFVASPTTHPGDTIAIMVVAQLMPDTPNSSTAAATAAGSSSTADASGSADQQQQQDAEQQGSDQQQGGADGLGSFAGTALRCVVQLAVRASSHEVLLAVKQQPETWVADISQGTLCVSVSSGVSAPRPSRGKTLLHPSVARLEQQLSTAAAVMKPPAPVPPLELPPLPTFDKKLRNKKDEEDSDAEDEELPLTVDEQAEQQAELEKHAAACDKAREAHAAAKRQRAVAVLRQGALSEWRRIACPALA